MLHIISCGTDDSRHCLDTHWRVGESAPNIPENTIDSVQADGEELTYIRNNFQNIPICTHRHVVSWEGEMARFILRHL